MHVASRLNAFCLMDLFIPACLCHLNHHRYMYCIQLAIPYFLHTCPLRFSTIMVIIHTQILAVYSIIYNLYNYPKYLG